MTAMEEYRNGNTGPTHRACEQHPRSFSGRGVSRRRGVWRGEDEGCSPSCRSTREPGAAAGRSTKWNSELNIAK